MDYYFLIKTAYSSTLRKNEGHAGVYLEPSRTYKMKLFAKIVSGFQLLTIFTKSSILGVHEYCLCRE